MHPRELSGQRLYDAHRHSVLVFTGEWLPHWNWLSWQERTDWEDKAVEQAGRDERNPS